MDHILWYHKTSAECVKHGVMCALCRRDEGFGSNVKKRLQLHALGIILMETAAKKIRIVKPGDNVMVPVPYLDRAMIDAYSLHAVIVEEYSNDQFKLGTRYVSTLVWNKK